MAIFEAAVKLLQYLLVSRIELAVFFVRLESQLRRCTMKSAMQKSLSKLSKASFHYVARQNVLIIDDDVDSSFAFVNTSNCRLLICCRHSVYVYLFALLYLFVLLPNTVCPKGIPKSMRRTILLLDDPISVICMK